MTFSSPSSVSYTNACTSKICSKHTNEFWTDLPEEFLLLCFSPQLLLHEIDYYIPSDSTENLKPNTVALTVDQQPEKSWTIRASSMQFNIAHNVYHLSFKLKALKEQNIYANYDKSNLNHYHLSSKFIMWFV